MTWLIELALNNRRAVTVAMLALVLLGILCISLINIDILPVYDRPAVQVITFYSGMDADSIAHTITNPMERWTGTSSGMRRQESRSILGASIIHNLFRKGTDPNGALTEVNSLALAEIPNLPPGTLPPLVLPYDPTGTVPVCFVAVDSKNEGESTLYDVARYEVRNMIMSSPGAESLVVYGGKMRAVMVYVDPIKLQARGLSPLDLMNAVDKYNVFLPTGDAKFGQMDYAINSNSMFRNPRDMVDIPTRVQPGKTDFLGDVAEPRDSHFIQMSVVRINGKREVAIPVFRQHGASTLSVVNHVKESAPDWEKRLSVSDINLKVVMDQSVYVSQSIKSLAIEGILGAVLCSLVILLFLGQWRMTLMAVLTIPISVLSAIALLYVTDQTINMMTLAGLALAIGPMVDSAIICLENTERHLAMGASVRTAAKLGASEVALPELVATCSTLLVLAPLALMPSSGQFLFRPMALAVAFAMISAYVLSRSFIPSRSASWLKAKGGRKAEQESGQRQEGANASETQREGREDRREAIQGERSSQEAAQRSHSREEAERSEENQDQREREEEKPKGMVGRFFAHLQNWIDAATRWYGRRLQWVMNHRLLIVFSAFGLLIALVVMVGPFMRREYFPEVDSGSFDIYVRAPSGTRIERTELYIEQIEKAIRDIIGDDLEMTLCELGVNPDLSAAYTPNSGPGDTVVKVQLKEDRKHTSQEHAQTLRERLGRDNRFLNLNLAFNTGGTVRSALNEGRPTPISIRLEGKYARIARKIAERIRNKVTDIEGVVDARILQRFDYPEFIIEVDRAKSRALGLTQEQIMKDVVAAIKSSIQFYKKMFWIDPRSQNQYWVGIQYPEGDIRSLHSILNVSSTSSVQKKPIPLSNLVKIRAATIASEVTHADLQTTVDLEMSVHGRDLGHVADDIKNALNEFGQPESESFWSHFSLSEKQQQGSVWTPYNPDSPNREPLQGTSLHLSGEYEHMNDTFKHFGIGLVLAIVFVYFLMVTLLDSYVIPLVILSAVPVGLCGVIPVLFLTGTAINVQSLLGVIFMVGIIVSNTVLLTDFAETTRKENKWTPTKAIIEAAKIRARPVVMTALAALFALIPMALALEKGSEANAPLGRAVIGGLLAGLLTTLVVVPALYSLAVRDDAKTEPATE